MSSPWSAACGRRDRLEAELAGGGHLLEAEPVLRIPGRVGHGHHLLVGAVLVVAEPAAVVGLHGGVGEALDERQLPRDGAAGPSGRGAAPALVGVVRRRLVIQLRQPMVPAAEPVEVHRCALCTGREIRGGEKRK